MKKYSELALPAGSLQCALYAFKGGADAVYLGMKSFSARKGAVNFSFEDLRKLKQVCLELGKKYYITLNTLVKDSDLSDVYELLKELDFLQPDGIIIQDLGIAKIIRDYFPSLEMHASTQLAVHTINGVKELVSLGFKRVVLSRELSFEEIKTIREACPEVEIKVFIHGALCYGFSGLCMASQQLTGRSANCGECAQICRTYFTCKETGQTMWPFSMDDLKVGELVQKYRDIGIDSLKVEGRMKGPEYVYYTALYYRMLLDGKSEKDAQVQLADEALSTTFLRKPTTFFFNGRQDNLVCEDYPSHRGFRVGYIRKVLSNKAEVFFEKPVSIRDGLLVIANNHAEGFALKEIEGSKSFVSSGEVATINFPSSKFSKKPEYGTQVMCTSRHNQNLPLLNENINLYKKPIDIDVIIEKNSLTINSCVFPLEIQMANKPQDLDKIFTDVFSSSDKSYFTLGYLKITNKSSFVSPFIPLSVLKQIRRDFYSKLDAEFELFLSEKKTFETIDIPKVISYISLDSVTFDEKSYLDSLEIDSSKIYGLNNIGQILWAKRHPEIKVTADSFLYTHNSQAYKLLKEELPNLVGSTDENDRKLPMFISRVCFRHNALHLPCTGCSKDNTYHLEQSGKTYTVKCKNCITTVSRD